MRESYEKLQLKRGQTLCKTLFLSEMVDVCYRNNAQNMNQSIEMSGRK